MARVTKEPDVRRDELLDVALRLSLDVGFESMSVDQLTREVGVAKGTFYHYFSSKSALMFALVRRFGDSLFNHLAARAQQPDSPGEHASATERLRDLIAASSAWKLEHFDDAVGSMSVLYEPENLALRHSLFSHWLERTRPLVLPIVVQGAQDGTFDVADPEATTEVLLSLWYDTGDRVWQRAAAISADPEAFVRQILAGVLAVTRAMERVLGTPDGTFTPSLDDDLQAAVQTLYEHTSPKLKPSQKERRA